MSDLPTRESLNQYLRTGLMTADLSNGLERIARGYADGRLVSLDAIDREAIRSVLIRFDAGTIKTLAKAEVEMLAALAVKGETTNEG